MANLASINWKELWEKILAIFAGGNTGGNTGGGNTGGGNTGGGSDNSAFAPKIGVSGLTYYWHNANQGGKLKPALDEIGKICNELKIARGNVIFPLEVHSDGGRPGAGVNWKEHYAARCKEIVDVAKVIHSYGFGVEVIAWNSNTPGKGYSKTWSKTDVEGNKKFILDNMRPMIKSIGWDRTMWLLCNENDSSTASTIQSAIKGLKKEMGIPDNRYLSNDVHPGDVNKLPSLSPPQTFTSDNGSIIGQLYDNKDYWVANGFNVANHKKVIDKYANKVLFNFYNLVLEETIVKHKDKWREVLAYFKGKVGGTAPANPTDPTGPVVPVNGILPSQVKWLSSRGKDYKNAKIVFNITEASISGSRLYFKTDKKFPEPWEEREKGVNSVGFLIRKIGNDYVGGKCEWCVETRGWYDIATNVLTGYNGHTVPAAGEKVWCGIGHPDNGSECSSLVEVTWPSIKVEVSGEGYVGEFPDLE